MQISIPNNNKKKNKRRRKAKPHVMEMFASALNKNVSVTRFFPSRERRESVPTIGQHGGIDRGGTSIGLQGGEGATWLHPLSTEHADENNKREKAPQQIL